MSDLYFRESPIKIGEGASKSWSCKLDAFDGSAVTLSGSITTTAYKNGSGNDIVADLDTGSASVSGNVLTTQTFSGWDAGNEYVIAWYCLINGVQDLVGKMKVVVESDKE